MLRYLRKCDAFHTPTIFFQKLYFNWILKGKSGMELHQRIRVDSSAAPAQVPFPPNTVLPHYLDTAFQLSAQTAVLHI